MEWKDMTPDQRLAKRLDGWVNMPDFEFSGPEAEAVYKERARLFRDAIELKIPARVPVFPSEGFFAIFHAGMTMKDALYDYDGVVKAVTSYYHAFEPDSWLGPLVYVPGPAFDILDYKLYDWPGQKIEDNYCYQMNEGEYLYPDEYKDLSNDPSGFFLRKYMPRIFSTMKPLQQFPLLQYTQELPFTAPFLIPFGIPEVQQALHKLMAAGTEAMRWIQKMGELGMKMRSAGCVDFAGGASKAPYDVIGDTLRGTRGLLTDLYRRPDEVIEACQRLVPLMVEMGIDGVNVSGVPGVFMPLHKGADGFMSNEQFKKFYWPTLKAVMLGLVEQGCVPIMFAEGSYNERLEIIADFPKGKCIWWFDQTDMKKAKEVLGDVCCIAGNVPTSIMSVGTPEEVKAYCKNLIDVAGEGGGYILTNGCGIDNAKAENVRAMIEAGREFGVY
jgi:hypothetical protein